MILITGATGQLGKAAIDFLLTKVPASSLAVLVRDASKATEFKTKGINIRVGDYNDYASLVSALKGVDKMYFISSSDIANRLQQQANVVKAAKVSGVKHVVYTSFQRKNETDTSPIALVAQAHIQTEKLLKESGLTYTILKHSLYTDMLPMFIGDKVLETGIIFQPAGSGKVSFATRADMAEAGAVILTTTGHENKVYEISGTASYSYHQIAEIISGLSGKNITYVSPTSEEFRQELTKAGVPADYVGVFTSFSEAIKQGEFDFPDATLEKLLGRKPVSPKDFLKGVYTPVSVTA
jgi:NAD(P)H dehydrogenase (quinone)